MFETDVPEINAHFSQQVSEDLVEYVTETVFLYRRYVFVWREGDVQMAYCTHCKQEYPIGVGSFYFKHNEATACLHCKSVVKVKSAGRGRSKMIDEAHVVWYEKSQINPRAIVARSLHVIRDYRGPFRFVETKFRAVACYQFEQANGSRKGEVRMFRLNWKGDWWEASSAYSLIGNDMKYKEPHCSAENVSKAVAGTPFQYCAWERYKDFNETYDCVRYFALAAKYPCVEYLTKLGFEHIVRAKLMGMTNYRVINWRGRSIEKVLGLSKQELRQLREIPGPIHALTLYGYRRFKHLGFTLLESHLLRDFAEDYHAKGLRTTLRDLDFAVSQEVLFRYILKQMRRDGAPNRYCDRATYVLMDWRDYIRECKELGMDTADPRVAFPNDLHEAHQKTMRKVKLKKDEALNELILARLPELARFSFTDGTFLLRPAKDSVELFDEGKCLNHCVGGYADRYAKGETDIFLIRCIAAPDEPFYTIEVRDGRIIQCRGLKNCLATTEVQAFIDHFEARKLRTTKVRMAM